MPPKVLGADPGLAAFGVALVELQPDGERVIALEVVRTRPSPRKGRVLAADDTIRRGRELAAALADWLADPQVVAVCAESPSWPRSASSAAKAAVAHGVLAASVERRGLPLLHAGPQALKRAVTGRADASKSDVQAALEARYGPLPWPRQRTLREHCADALGAVVACIGADAILLARRMAALGGSDA